MSREIEAATSAPDFMEWWSEVQAEVKLLREKQAKVRESIEKGSYIQKAEAIRSLIDRITCHWETVPTTDGRYKRQKDLCQAVTIESKATAKDTDG